MDRWQTFMMGNRGPGLACNHSLFGMAGRTAHRFGRTAQHVVVFTVAMTVDTREAGRSMHITGHLHALRPDRV